MLSLRKLRTWTSTTVLKADGTDLAYINIDLTDDKGTVIDTESNAKVNISVSGQGILLAAGNAHPYGLESFRSSSPKLYRGQALAIVKAAETEGFVTLNVECNGITNSITIPVTNDSQETAIRQTSRPDTPIVYVQDGIATVKGTDQYKIYNLGGIELPKTQTLDKGIYIITGNGFTKKIRI